MPIRLTQEVLRELLDYDPETGVLTWRERPRKYFPSAGACRWWNRRFAGTAALSAINKDGALQGTLLGKNVLAHRIAWKWTTGRWPTPMVDHRDGNPANNKWNNLRQVSAQQNARNCARSTRNTSGHVGIYINEHYARRKYVATIGSGGRLIFLGSFARLELAVAARAAAQQLLGFDAGHGRRVKINTLRSTRGSQRRAGGRGADGRRKCGSSRHSALHSAAS
jgi:hypothetical protein